MQNFIKGLWNSFAVPIIALLIAALFLVTVGFYGESIFRFLLNLSS
ncbi:hypothetical protein H9650_11465 [Psychrobacillus sp. Sa2BUA9]|uniref:Uncharacterized protein n=1 Tax=Psychrobacillus faecigallinarum TaxID=2762235 RepID=A0ABR8RAB1_9BACI|nr:hypothetical protein [Psychrobacillus faecigallinarum]MBD7944734.1 hypothetical protein [Psychrobacillus faecigallinarum]